MAPGKDKQLIYQKIREYLRPLNGAASPSGGYTFMGPTRRTPISRQRHRSGRLLDRDDIDGFDEDVLLRKLSCDVDLRIEPHSFARTDFDETDPYIKEIIETGERII